MADDLVTVGQFQFGPEAEAARLHLEEVGIPAYISDGETVTMDWLLGNAIGYVKVQVATSQAEAALAVLEKMKSAPRRAEEAGEGDGDSQTCLACGAEMARTSSKCASCGWSYQDGETNAAETGPARVTADEDEPAGSGAGLESMRSLKKPVLLFFLYPLYLLLIFLAFLPILFVVWLCNQIFE
jgi:hypothetical protein